MLPVVNTLLTMVPELKMLLVMELLRMVPALKTPPVTVAPVMCARGKSTWDAFLGEMTSVLMEGKLILKRISI